ncbi:hypothetical protein RRG08_014880 [Elysia crispata]|uniref:Uncharacterized protein n=1 Tax=Elysia crispata TaxID=231223 RepID=A0AAE1E128_9GAST|nr:hypothetical protein RRG08_014880 [Elysia crispata]
MKGPQSMRERSALIPRIKDFRFSVLVDLVDKHQSKRLAAELVPSGATGDEPGDTDLSTWELSPGASAHVYRLVASHSCFAFCFVE